MHIYFIQNFQLKNSEVILAPVLLCSSPFELIDTWKGHRFLLYCLYAWEEGKEEKDYRPFEGGPELKPTLKNTQVQPLLF